MSINPRGIRARELTGTLAAAFTPTFVFVRTDGQIHNIFIGEVDEDRLRQELDLLMQSQDSGEDS